MGDKMISTLRQAIRDFHEIYLASPEGKQQFRTTTETEPRYIKQAFADIRENYRLGADITDMVLQRLLPHFDSQFHRANNYHVSTWPAIRKDIRDWFEGIGWKKPEDWEPTAKMLFEALDGVVQGDWNAWDRFVRSDYRRGFGTGMVTPALFCLNNQFPVINSRYADRRTGCN